MQKLNEKPALLDYTTGGMGKLAGKQGFAAQARRRVSKDTRTWLIRWRRLVRDDIQCIDVSHDMIEFAIGFILPHRPLCQ